VFQFQRAVIKVGSALIAPDGKQCSAQHLLSIARFVTESRKNGRQIVLVSSGSVAAGRNHIKFGEVPTIAEKQAMAAVGQSMMMANWQRFFDFPCAQILLTHDDLRDRTRYVNIKNTIRELLDNDVLPIINENDSVAIEELKVGDNDNLAAQVALVSEADALVICSDIDGLYNKDPRNNPDAKLLPVVKNIDSSIYNLAGGTTNKLATGGMRTKIEAADKATRNGIQTLIVNGSKGEVFDQLLEGGIKGTHFSAAQTPVTARKHWLKDTLKAKGVIVIDDGAVNAVVNRGASLLSSGIVSCSGVFKSGDAIDIGDRNNNIIARGICQYSNLDIEKIKGKNSREIASLIGYQPSDAVVHRDDLALIKAG
jgi:glutamate 5-kinase